MNTPDVRMRKHSKSGRYLEIRYGEEDEDSLLVCPAGGSHLPVLMKAVAETTGPILELGCGLCSTNFLHWACYASKRKLVTYENNPRYYELLKTYEKDFHEVYCISDWDDIDISGPWSVALVDHMPEFRRGMELERLHHAEYVVAHDAQPRQRRTFGYRRRWRKFKYAFTYSDAYPPTMVLSNTHDVTDFFGEVV